MNLPVFLSIRNKKPTFTRWHIRIENGSPNRNINLRFVCHIRIELSDRQDTCMLLVNGGEFVLVRGQAGAFTPMNGSTIQGFNCR